MTKVTYGDRPFIIKAEMKEVINGYLQHLIEEGEFDTDGHDFSVKKILLVGNDEQQCLMNTNISIQGSIAD